MKLQVFHNAVAPYRIDFFNSLCKHFDTNICLFYRRFVQSDYIDSEYVNKRLTFVPEYREDFRGLNTISNKNAVKQSIKKNEPDIVLTMEYGITTLLAVLYRFLWRRNYKVVSMVDESYDMAVGKSQFTWRHRLAKKFLLPHIDDVIVVNDCVQDYYKRNFGKGIYFPIITDDAAAYKRQKAALELSRDYVKRYNLTGKKVILYVGRLIALKNIDTIIKTFNVGEDPDRILVIVGDGEEKEHLRNLCDGRQDVIFTGALHGDNLYAWYNIAQLFVLPSIIESFGAVVNEALQGGCICIVSDVAGSCCLIKEGYNGYTVSPHDEVNWQKTITKALDTTATIPEIPVLRESKMPLSFKEYMESLVTRLKAIV